jgi:hypothetical protein
MLELRDVFFSRSNEIYKLLKSLSGENPIKANVERLALYRKLEHDI